LLSYTGVRRTLNPSLIESPYDKEVNFLLRGTKPV